MLIISPLAYTIICKFDVQKLPFKRNKTYFKCSSNTVDGHTKQHKSFIRKYGKPTHFFHIWGIHKMSLSHKVLQ